MPTTAKKDTAQKLKEKVAKEVNALMKKSSKELIKEINGILKSNGLWYSTDDVIKHYDDMHKLADRNADQLVSDHYDELVLDSSFIGVKTTDLWSKDDINA